MPYSTLYKNLIQSETATSKSRIRPRKVYKITGYEYADGHIESYRGSNSVLVFILGIFHKKVYCLKITEIKPEKFFKWLKSIMFKHLKEEDFHNLKYLENFIPKADKAGAKIYNTSVKGKSIMQKEPSAFRTYILPNIKQISWVEFKLEEIEKFYGIKTTSKESKKVHEDIKKEPPTKEQAVS
jgi:hypothetical protein